MKFINNSNDLAKLLNIKIAKDIKISNVSTDTRDLKPESLFFAIKGEKFNYHNYTCKNRSYSERFFYFSFL